MTHFQIFQFFSGGFDPKPDSWTTKQRSNSLVSLKKYFCGRKCNTWAYLYFRHKSPWIPTFSRERRGILALVGRTNFSTRRRVHFLVLSTQTSRADENATTWCLPRIWKNLIFRTQIYRVLQGCFKPQNQVHFKIQQSLSKIYLKSKRKEINKLWRPLLKAWKKTVLMLWVRIFAK